jgi:hypothetical membrane protein
MNALQQRSLINEGRLGPLDLTRLLARIGAAGPPVFLAVATVAGLAQPGFDLRTNSISEAALGPFGWLQTLNFYVFGLAIVAFALRFASFSRVASGLLVVSGFAIAASGAFPTDPAGAAQTGAGQLHNLLALVAFGSTIVSFGFSAWALRRQAGWGGHALYTALCLPLSLALLVVYIGVASDPGDPLYAVGGLLERALVLVAFGWMTLTGRRLLAAA